MSAYRANSAGNQPFNNGLCQQFLGKATINGVTSSTGGHILPGTTVPINVIPGNLLHLIPSGATSVIIPKTGPLSMVSNIPLQAYCHAIVTNNELWIAAAGWGIVVFLLGIVFFWQAEALYGRG